MSGGMWNRTLIYLGLREEPEEAYDDLPERLELGDDEPAELRHVGRGSREERDAGVAEVRPLYGNDSHVRPQPAARAAVVEIATFDDVEAVGARYRSGQAVLFDLAAAGTTDARRVVDFVSGLTYALEGSLTKVGSRAFLLVPAGLRLAEEERRRLIGLGYRLPGGSEA